VDVFDGSALRLAFASSNAADVTLTIPRPEIVNTTANNSGAGAGDGTVPSDGAAPSAASLENSSSPSERNSTTSIPSSAKSNDVSSPTAANPARRNAAARESSEKFMVVTRLDGTVVTSSVPQSITNSFADDAQAVASQRETTNPLIEFVQWLTRLSARGTYWLLFLLLLALAGFEIARRRAQRKRARKAEITD
jgi:hypothetical protein